jgi:hypothetical protein
MTGKEITINIPPETRLRPLRPCRPLSSIGFLNCLKLKGIQTQCSAISS